ncbi:MAG: efflux RND transporter periplasmic adaptor subunit [Pirellulales bacterium]|nr:efflux RND transporter periplasmic adaptor subunit [Pirellulales bacterium]
MDALVLRPWTLLAIVAPALLGCHSAEPGNPESRLPKVRVVHPVEKAIIDYEYFTGRCEAPESVDLRARVTGYLVPWNFEKGSSAPPRLEFNFVPGEEVKVNQVLFKIDQRPYKADYDMAVAQIALAKARLQLAIADYSRAKEVAKTPGAISQQDVDKYFAAQGEAAAEVQAAEANAEKSRLNLQFTDVISPINGVVSRNLLSVGNLVNADTTLLTTIVSEDPMYVYFDVDERTVLRVQQLLREDKWQGIREGNRIEVGLALAIDEKDFPHKAYMDFVNNQIDPTTGTLQVRGTLPNPAPQNGPRRFAQGMFVRVQVPVSDEHQALLVPQEAIGTDQGKRFVMIVNKETIAEKRPVDVGDQQPNALQEVVPQRIVVEQDGYRLPKEGEVGAPSLTAADQVIVGGLIRVRPGTKVEIRSAETTSGR